MTSAAHEDVALNAVTRSKTKKALATPDIAVSPLATWTARTLIDPGNAWVTVAANYAPKTPARPVENAAVSEFVLQRQSIACFVRDALQDAVDKQKEKTDKRGRKNMATFARLRQEIKYSCRPTASAVTNLGASKLAPRFIGPFIVMKVNGEAYTLDIPTSLRLHPTFYVGRLKKYHAVTIPSATTPPAPERSANTPRDNPGRDPGRTHLVRVAEVTNLFETPVQFQPRDDTEYVGSASLLKRTRGSHVPSSFGMFPMSCETMRRSSLKSMSPRHSPRRLDVQTTEITNGDLRRKHAARFAVMIKTNN
ncbi:hypothetical protein PF002_g10830 [Phytophthora fragariae]|uniref:Tf2-1-like SH3-like domain-containing protein n=1 Tax=Phytophthora fragariae TaxID=53985 RepID=A0A6A3ZKU9_9STRA|nr:hypothetical protein PF002_g10830 [Phytophthora fragariae]